MSDRSREMIKIAINSLENRKAQDLKVIDISEISVIADYFLIAGGNNRNQIQALSDHLEEELGRAGYSPRQIEGYNQANWVLLDYSDIIVHIFDKESRSFYDLERLWKDGKPVDLDELRTE